MKTKYALDTQIINWVCDGIFDLSFLQPAEFFITVVQEQELRASKDRERNARLLRHVTTLVEEVQPAESFVFGAAGLPIGNWRWSDGVTFQRILDEMNATSKKRNNVEDALIGEHALKNRLVLLTGDRNLARAMTALGAYVHFFEHPSKGER